VQVAEYNKQKFDEFVTNVRDDLSILRTAFETLLMKINEDATTDSTREFAFDVFLDKCFEINGKISQFKRDFSLYIDQSYEIALSKLKGVIEAISYGERFEDNIELLTRKFDNYNRWLAKALNDLRRQFYIEGWRSAKPIRPAKYLLQKRKKFVTARDELEKAKELIQAEESSDAITHIRSAIELAIKEKFGFNKIKSMKTFVVDAEQLGFPIVSYDLIYQLYDFGSKRLHRGRILEPFEAEEILRVTSRYIERLEILQVPQDKIVEFRAKSKSVE